MKNGKKMIPNVWEVTYFNSWLFSNLVIFYIFQVKTLEIAKFMFCFRKLWSAASTLSQLSGYDIQPNS